MLYVETGIRGNLPESGSLYVSLRLDYVSGLW